MKSVHQAKAANRPTKIEPTPTNAFDESRWIPIGMAVKAANAMANKKKKTAQGAPAGNPDE